MSNMKRVCPKCGRVFSQEDGFCDDCGCRLILASEDMKIPGQPEQNFYEQPPVQSQPSQNFYEQPPVQSQPSQNFTNSRRYNRSRTSMSSRQYSPSRRRNRRRRAISCC